jgi:hypothetical protein
MECDYVVQETSDWEIFGDQVVVKRDDEKCCCDPVFRTGDGGIGFSYNVVLRKVGE